MTDAEMALDLHAHMREENEGKQRKGQSEFDRLLANPNATVSDAAAWDAGVKALMEDNMDIDDVIAMATQAAREAAGATGEVWEDDETAPPDIEERIAELLT